MNFGSSWSEQVWELGWHQNMQISLWEIDACKMSRISQKIPSHLETFYRWYSSHLDWIRRTIQSIFQFYKCFPSNYEVWLTQAQQWRKFMWLSWPPNFYKRWKNSNRYFQEGNFQTKSSSPKLSPTRTHNFQYCLLHGIQTVENLFRRIIFRKETSVNWNQISFFQETIMQR